MFLKRNIEIKMHSDNSFINVYALYKCREVGRIACGIDERAKLVMVGDITCKRKNRGYGSLMMEKLIEFAKANNFREIKGWLSCVDRGHEKRLYHFYQKFGFKIVPHDEGIKFADIKLSL